MEDKDKLFSFGGFKLGTIDDGGFKELPIVETPLVTFQNEEQTDEAIYTAGTYSFNCDNVQIDKAFSDFLYSADMQPQNDNAIRSRVLIQCGDDYINRPKNLKYPNKKRARRIWKKWKKRFGVREAKYYVMPKVTIKPSYELKNGLWVCSLQITAEEISK